MARYTPAVPIAAEVAYTRRLQRRIVAPWTRLLRDALAPAIAAYRGPGERADDGGLPDVATILRGVRVQYLQQVDVDAEALAAAQAAAKSVDDFNARQQRLALRAVGLDVYAGGKETAQLRALRDQFVQRNVALIKTIPEHHFGQIETWIKGAIHDGARHETLAGDLVDKLALPDRRAKLIARDQVSKHNGALARERQQAVGLTRYRWSATLDRRTRPDHASLHDTIQRWDAPPAIGNPGEPIQCRCVAIPVMGDGEGAAKAQQQAPAPQLEPVQVQAPHDPKAGPYKVDATGHFEGMDVVTPSDAPPAPVSGYLRGMVAGDDLPQLERVGKAITTRAQAIEAQQVKTHKALRAKVKKASDLMNEAYEVRGDYVADLLNADPNAIAMHDPGYIVLQEQQRKALATLQALRDAADAADPWKLSPARQAFAEFVDQFGEGATGDKFWADRIVAVNGADPAKIHEATEHLGRYFGKRWQVVARRGNAADLGDLGDWKIRDADMPGNRVRIENTGQNRADCAYWEGRIRVGPNTLADTYTHEMVHWIEAWTGTNPVQAAALEYGSGRSQGHWAVRQFFDARTKGKPLEQLQVLFTGSDYKPDEVIRRGGFFELYAGKVYQQNRTGELLTMGYQQLHKDPAVLVKDPQYLGMLALFGTGRLL